MSFFKVGCVSFFAFFIFHTSFAWEEFLEKGFLKQGNDVKLAWKIRTQKIEDIAQELLEKTVFLDDQNSMRHPFVKEIFNFFEEHKGEIFRHNRGRDVPLVWVKHIQKNMHSSQYLIRNQIKSILNCIALFEMKFPKPNDLESILFKLLESRDKHIQLIAMEAIPYFFLQDPLFFQKSLTEEGKSLKEKFLEVLFENTSFRGAPFVFDNPILVRSFQRDSDIPLKIKYFYAVKFLEGQHEFIVENKNIFNKIFKNLEHLILILDKYLKKNQKQYAKDKIILSDLKKHLSFVLNFSE